MPACFCPHALALLTVAFALSPRALALLTLTPKSAANIGHLEHDQLFQQTDERILPVGGIVDDAVARYFEF